MQPFFMGTAERRLFAIFNAAPAMPRQPRGPAVLVCGPHGQEAVRSHRLLRVLADRLVRAGCDVLRFDPYGTGDSAGADEELDWPGWIADLRQAAAELSRRSPGRPQVWLGLRLGATAACAAAQRSVHRANPEQVVEPAALVLCEPVLDGAAYLRSLAVATVQALEASCSIKDPAWRRTLRDDPASLEREAVGFALGPSLHEALRRLSLEALERPAVASIDVIAPRPDGSLDDLSARWTREGRAVTIEVVSYRFDWTAEHALNTAIVPNELVQRIVDRVASAEAAAHAA